jgi:O-6-methylguanine DNA methyltransferase
MILESQQVKVHHSTVPKFNAQIYAIVQQIPKGRVTTYGQIAKLTRINSPRVVGNALHHNPDPPTIPCHRVVNAKGMLAKNFAFGGLVGQKKKLEHEGVEVKNGRVDMEKFAWRLNNEKR